MVVLAKQHSQYRPPLLCNTLVFMVLRTYVCVLTASVSGRGSVIEADNCFCIIAKSSLGVGECPMVLWIVL